MTGSKDAAADRPEPVGFRAAILDQRAHQLAEDLAEAAILHWLQRRWLADWQPSSDEMVM
jgi:hypothetical protein